MHLGDVIDLFAGHLAAELPAPQPRIGSDAQATRPAVVLSIVGSQETPPGVGGAPRTLAHGALALTATIDLQSPVLVFPDETVSLLSNDRTSLQLPHAPLVNADGSSVTPLGAADLSVRLNGAPFTIVAIAPAGLQLWPDRVTGKLLFGSPLPAAGTLEAIYRVGEWAVETTRFAGGLSAAIRADTAADADALARQVAGALSRTRSRRMAGLMELGACGFGAIDAAPPPTGGFVQILSWRFAVEREEPIVITGGGPIRRIDVHSGTGPEDFSIA
ncbi:MAG: hypothetical protein HY020_18950 [Burkholderiales bacterium]|nr:hypothetical protein [Burkholderiales bacterium]